MKRIWVNMKNRVVYFMLCAISLAAGAIIYIVFRPNTYVSECVRNFIPVTQTFFSGFADTKFDFLKYYFSDFLWAFSFNCGLNVIFPEPKKVIVNGIIVCLAGVFWEIAQVIGIVSGTGDVIDSLMYFLAVLILLIPNVALFKKTK